MKLAHLSDLHFTTFFRNSELNGIESLLRYCNSEGVDHLIITGDLVERPEPYDFELLRKVFKQNGFLSSDRLSLVIGNHDIFGGVLTVNDVFSFPKHCETINYKQSVSEFCSYFKESFDGCSYISRENIFPYAKVIDDILIVGLNSVAEYSKTKNIFASNGEISQKQLSEVAKIFKLFGDCKTKLILIHHHFKTISPSHENKFGSLWQLIEKQTMKLKTKGKLMEMFLEYNVDMVLHGHYHESSEYYRKGLRFLNAGGSFKNELPNQNQINILETNNASLKVEINKISRQIFPQFLSLRQFQSINIS
jgi:3',5'-cyclic AMP phosphodiesterase CpdA